MKHHLVLSSCLVLTLAACSSPGSKNAAKGSFEYANKEEPNIIRVPSNLNMPRISDHYKVSEVENTNGPIGKSVDIRAPALALPLAAGTRIEPEDKGAKVWFDQVDDTAQLIEQIRRALGDLFIEKNVSLATDKTALVYKTGWIEKVSESGMWFWKSMDTQYQSKFEISLTPKPHGRSVSLTANLVDFEDVGSDDNFTEIDKGRAEIALVNEIVSHLSYQYRVDEFSRQRAIAKEDLVKRVTDSSALIVQLPLDSLWENMPTFFEKYGFTQTDLNETEKVYFVDYEKPDSSFWDSVWGDALPILLLNNGAYRFKLVEVGKETRVELLGADGNALAVDKFNEIYDVLANALTFR